jgi:hypothetical protein
MQTLTTAAASVTRGRHLKKASDDGDPLSNQTSYYSDSRSQLRRNGISRACEFCYLTHLYII